MKIEEVKKEKVIKNAFLSCRVPQKYKDFVEKHKLSASLIMMKAIDELENQFNIK